MRRSALLLLLVACAAPALSGCAVVKPWEREVIARRDMAFDPDPLEAQRREHVYFAKEASLQGSGSGGGGCGCN